jgi:hypothetical protein
MKRYTSIAILSFLILTWIGLLGCKTTNASGTVTAPTLTFTQATNASLQAAHKFGSDIAASVEDGSLLLTPSEKQAFNLFVTSLNATDVLFIAYNNGAATQAQVETSLANTSSLQVTTQVALAKGN